MYLNKTADEVLAEALYKVKNNTTITSVGPGSVARAIIEAITSEIGELYSILDFNTSLYFISTAQGKYLDLMGDLFGLARKTLSNAAAFDKSLGVFYFYLDSPYSQDIIVPSGTQVSTSTTGTVGLSFSYATVDIITIPAGRTRTYATIRPLFTDAVFSAGVGTLTVISPSFTQPVSTTLKAYNPKPIQATQGFEDDDSYRTRIVKAVRTAAGGTLEAVRLAGLSVSGVRDITIREAPYGLGSFEALVISEDNLINGPVLVAATNLMNSVRPVGVNMFVRQPDLVPIDVEATIVLRNDIAVDTVNASSRTQVGILRFLNQPVVGTPLIFNQLIQSILDATDVVTDVTITKLAANGVEILRKNYTPDSDQQIIPGSITVTPAQ